MRKRMKQRKGLLAIIMAVILFITIIPMNGIITMAGEVDSQSFSARVEDVTVEYGESAILSVVTFDKVLSYQWKYKDDDGRWCDIEGGTEGSYTIDCVTQPGTYSCWVAYSDANSPSGYNVEVLTCNVKIENYLTCIADVPKFYLEKGDSATMKVTASCKNGDLTYQWYKYDSEQREYITIDDAVSISYTATDVSETEKYKCIVTDIYGNQDEVQFTTHILGVELPQAGEVCVYTDANDYEIGRLMESFYAKYPDYKENVTICKLGWDVSSDEYADEVTHILKVNTETEGTAIVELDCDNLNYYVNSDLLADMKDIGITDEMCEDAYPYTRRAASKDGALKALAWECCIGDFMYDTVIAEEVLGTCDPEAIQAMIDTPEEFLNVAEKMKTAGYYMTSGAVDFLNDMISSETNVYNILDSDKETLNKIAQNIALFDTGHAQWMGEWGDDIRSGNVFGWFGVPWFDIYSFPSYEPPHEMAICKGPFTYSWGGRYLGVSKQGGADNIAKLVLETLCCDEEVLYHNGWNYNFVPNNRKASRRMIADGENLHLSLKNGQNALATWNRIAAAFGVEEHTHVPMIEEAIAPTCTESGKTEGSRCEICEETINTSETIPATGHMWNAGVVTKKATALVAGVKTYTCTVCGAKKTKAIPATGAPKYGTMLTDKTTNGIYRVTKAGTKNGTLEYRKPVNTSATTITIPSTVKIDGITYKVTSVASSALKNNKKVTKITIGSNVTKIGTNAFYGCTALKTVTIGKNVTSIGSKAFYKCTKLSSITIPSKVTTIGSSAFYGCKYLKKIKMTAGNLKTIGKSAFSGISKQAVFTLSGTKSAKTTLKKLLQKTTVGYVKTWKITL